ncbi:MAG: DUF4625 domain-containing protein [Bacteroidales bacterium]|nr:DUF4625 domain-containing protein [Bacteroidales bacterium]
MKKNTLILIFAAVVLAFVSVSCKKDAPVAKPQITLTEVGHENSLKAMCGDDMHLEADILAEGLISRIDVEIHQEGGSFEIEKTYTDGKYIGVKNVEFHEHIDIPADAPLGEYHLHFTVADREGQTSQVEAHIQVIEFDEHEHHEE